MIPLSLPVALETIFTFVSPHTIVRILSSYGPPHEIDPTSLSFFNKINCCTSSLGIATRRPNGVAALADFRSRYGKIQTWKCYLPTPVQFILTEHKVYHGAALACIIYKAYEFTGNLFLPRSADTLTGQSAERTKELRQFYAKLT